MTDYYAYTGFMFVEILGLLFINQWGKKVIPTFLSGVLFIFAISNYRPIIDVKNILNVILPIISTGSLLLLIFFGLKQINNLSILKEKTIYFSFIVSFVLCVISFFINKKTNPHITLKDYYNVFLTILILPILYELFIHEIIWKLISKKNNRVIKIVFFVVSSIILIWASCVDWAYCWPLFIAATITILGAGIYRLFFTDNKDFWICILFRSIFYFIMFTFI